MHKILFVCHGNICRSTMAQFITQNLVNKAAIQNDFFIDSAATSREAVGMSPDRRAMKKLKAADIPILEHRSRQIKIDDYDKFDLIIIMDERNRKNIKKIFATDPQNKIHKLLEYVPDYDNGRLDIEDPWYTLDFNTAFNDIMAGCKGLLQNLRGNEAITKR